MAKQTFDTKRTKKIKKIIDEVTLNIDYDTIDKEDIYGYYIMNRMEPSSMFDIPFIGDFHDDYPEYIALFNHPKEYNINEKTCLAFYIKDSLFDDIDGLYAAIIHKDVLLLKYYKWLLRDIKYIIAPDYSIKGNFKESTVIHQLEKEAVVIGWLTFELNVIVYPNITYGSEKTFKYCFSNIYYGSNIAISLKGCIDNGIDEKNINAAIKQVVDSINPLAIVVYSVASDETTYRIMNYALEKSIKVLVVDNTLRLRNLRRLKTNG